MRDLNTRSYRACPEIKRAGGGKGLEQGQGEAGGKGGVGEAEEAILKPGGDE